MYKEIDITKLKIDVANKGYVYFTDSKHPLAYTGSGKVYYHRHVASIMLGRWITTDEVVHHIDGDKTNNTQSNLQVLSAEEHGRLHKNADTYEVICSVCGTIIILPKSKLNSSNTHTCSIKCKGIQSRKSTCSVSKEKLQELIWLYPYTTVGQMVGLSDNGVRKRAKSLGCIVPPRHYHLKSLKQRMEIASSYNISL